MTPSYWYLVLAWVLYFGLHSILASAPLKAFFRRLGFTSQGYRLGYSLVAIATLLAVLYYGATLPRTWVLPYSNALRMSGLILATYGLLVTRLAFKNYSFRAFVGLASQTDDETEELKTDGLQGKLRHPLYAGLILILLGFLCFSPTLANAIAVGVTYLYLPLGIWLEERKLIERFGDAYREYQAQVPALLPHWPWWGK